MDTTSQAQAAPEQEHAHAFTFTGTAGEYFRIWIVNLLLSIVTLGIYTAWAKVRRLRYFYGNTWLDGHNFEYHARPKQILIGRIIVAVALVALNVLTSFNPLFGLVIIPYMLAFPWLINKSLAFNARMTSYRNVRLSFRGSYWGALGVFVAMPFAAILTLGILVPVSSRLSSNYIGRHLGFGTAKFETDARLGALYRNLGMSAVFTVICSLVIAPIGFGLLAALDPNLMNRVQIGLAGFWELAMVSAAVVVYPALILAFLFYAAGVRNVALNATTLDGKHRFNSHVGRLRYVWILVSNLIASIFTIGLLRPWAAIRTWRYLVTNTTLVASGTLDGFVDTAAPEGNVAAAEFFDIEGIDFGL